MKLLHLALLLGALAAGPAWADKDMLGREIEAPKRHAETPPPALPGLSGDVNPQEPQNSSEADAAAAKSPAPADAAAFEVQPDAAGKMQQQSRPKPPPVDHPPEDAGHRKPEGQQR
ncbi:MAG TPA: hypothetical protein VHE37_07625 [Nevskiaceae bacterium]|nr:hypothetical protein [Nevskiaceae bacterium]